MKRTIIRLTAATAVAAALAVGLASPAFADYDQGLEKMSASGSYTHRQNEPFDFTFRVTVTNINCNTNTVDVTAVPYLWASRQTGTNGAAKTVTVTKTSFRIGNRWECLGSIDTTLQSRQGANRVGYPSWAVTASAPGWAHERDVSPQAR